MIRIIGLALSLLAATAGCSADGPELALTGLSPPLACAAAPTATVALDGTGLTPLVLDTPSGAPRPLLPQIALRPALDLKGEPAVGPPILIPDSDTDPESSALHWQSETRLAFDLAPSTLAPGIYDVQVANPDGRQANLPQALALVPAPAWTGISPARACIAAAPATLALSGTGIYALAGQTTALSLLDASDAPVLTTSATPVECAAAAADLQSCTSLTFELEAGAAPPGSYRLAIGEVPACAGDSALRLILDPPPSVSAVAAPAQVCASGGTLQVTGTGFLDGATVTLRDPASGETTTATKVTVTGATGLSATFGANDLAQNTTLDLLVQNADGCGASLAGAVRLKPGAGGC